SATPKQNLAILISSVPPVVEPPAHSNKTTGSTGTLVNPEIQGDCANGSGAQALLDRATRRSLPGSQQPSGGLSPVCALPPQVQLLRCAMRLTTLRFAVLAFSGLLISAAPAWSEDASSASPQKAQSEKQRKKQQKKAKDELSYAFDQF